MIARLTVAEVAAALRMHPVTVRRALEAGELHGTQSAAGGRWSVREDCADAFGDRRPCEHQATKVVDLSARRRA